MSKTLINLSSELKWVVWLVLSLGAAQAAAQQYRGVVVDQKHQPIPGANVYLEGTYDGATTNSKGEFTFESDFEGPGVLKVSFIGYQSVNYPVSGEEQLVPIAITLKEEVNKLDAVVISAGSFEASDEKKGVVLKPMDIVTTAGATADIPGALNTLPGTQVNGETGRLFVRGGDDGETRVFIDGMLVQQFYNATPQNVPSRSRFSPFLFKGTIFSTGGYSAEYGQALSSALILNTEDLPIETETNLSLMTVGLDAAHTIRRENDSFYGQVQYTNLNPYNQFVNQEYDWEKGFTSLNSTFMYRKKTQANQLWKVYANVDHAGFIVNQPNINTPNQPDRTDRKNNYAYVNTSYQAPIGSKWVVKTGLSFNHTGDDIQINQDHFDIDFLGLHQKATFTFDASNKVAVRVGEEVFVDQYQQTSQFESGEHYDGTVSDQLLVTFAEADLYATNRLVFRPGLRVEHSTLLQQTNVAPRFSMAYKHTDKSQVSFAYGQFYQRPGFNRLTVQSTLRNEKASHYMLNYQWMNKDRTFRVEGYYKHYSQLVQFDDQFNPTTYRQGGSGYARGVDLFWRDRKSLKNVDYWVSYSFLDTERDYLDFPTASVPTFATAHNLSVVYKHFITPIRSQIGATYRFTSGRPYHDPNQEGFNQARTRTYQDLSFNMAYLFKPQIIFYTSITNLLGRDHVFGYQYTNAPDETGFYDRRAIGAPAKRFYFLGVFVTISKDKSKNQLDNL